MGACYAFLFIVVLVGPERMNHDVILRDRHKSYNSHTDEENKPDQTSTVLFGTQNRGE
jgi:hypothetical protein